MDVDPSAFPGVVTPRAFGLKAPPGTGMSGVAPYCGMP